MTMGKRRFLTPMIFVLAFSALSSCKVFESLFSNKQGNIEDISYWQGGKEKLVPKGTSATISIKKENFSLRFYNKKYNREKKEFYAVQIAAFLKHEDLDRLHEGMSKSETLCFRPGTGMAPARSGKYEPLIFKSKAHHYLFFNEDDDKRLNIIGEKDGYIKFNFDIKSLYYNKKEVAMENTGLSVFYLAILIDRNLNGTIDEGELKKLVVNLK